MHYPFTLLGIYCYLQSTSRVDISRVSTCATVLYRHARGQPKNTSVAAAAADLKKFSFGDS